MPNSTDTSSLAHNTTDNLNRNVSDIDNATIGIDRTYRIRVTVFDALGDTRYNSSEFGEVGVTLGMEDVGAGFGAGDAEIDIADDGNVISISGSGTTVAQALLANENGMFTYDANVLDDEPDNDGRYVQQIRSDAQLTSFAGTDTTSEGIGYINAPAAGPLV